MSRCSRPPAPVPRLHRSSPAHSGAIPARASPPAGKGWARLRAPLAALGAGGARAGVRALGAGLIVGLALALLAGGAVAREKLILQRTLSNETLARNFDIVVFRNEFNDRVNARLRKWTAPVRVYLDIRAGDPRVMRYLVERHVRRLAGITGHDIAVTPRPEKANITVVFERQSRLAQVGSDYFETGFNIQRVMQSNVCYGRYYSNSNHEIFEAVIVIPTDRAMSSGRLPACIIEELTQVLGLPNDSEAVFPSIFNDRSIDEDLTEQDIILVRLLYDPRLRPGMPREEVLHRIRGILKEIRR